MAKKIFILSAAFLILLFLFPFHCSLAQKGIMPVSDWYIKDFKSEIIVNKDSSLLITEKITADCDNLPDKHGIFRILPTEIKTEEGTIKNPIQLISITDFNGEKLKYSTINNPVNHTLTWKIGDPNKTVTGVNYYKITYKVKNAIRFGNPNFDELYWNLNGNFWEIITNSFTANIVFPAEVTKENSVVDYYTGLSGSKMKNLANYRWVDDNTLQFYSTQPFGIKEGITASITFPKNIFTPYRPSFIEKYVNILWLILPIFVFIICFVIWWKYGKDPRVNKTIIPEFEVPENIAPIEMGMLMTDGKLKNDFITASIINMATKGNIVIEEVEKRWFLGQKDFKLRKLKEKDENLNPTEQLIEDRLFLQKGADLYFSLLKKLPEEKSYVSQNEILLSSLKKRFFKYLSSIRESALDDLIGKGLLTQKGFLFKKVFGISITILLFLAYTILHFELTQQPETLFLAILISFIIIAIFASVMPKRTEKGAELLWKVNGFKLYMETAEKYREQFYEKENIFEKLLPYAIVFGMTKLWIKKMEQIYGAKYFETYHPVWFVGVNLGAFDVNSFTSTMNSISSSISSSTHGASGAGGGGFSGGGGGGGGGGGW